MNLWDMQTATISALPVCIWCGEVVTPSDERAPNYRQATHWECGLRAVVGGLNHLQGKCSCCGGTESPDPAGMTRREAARAAARHWLMNYRIPQ